MPEDYDLSDVIKKAQTSQVNKKGKRKAKLKWIISGVLALCVIGTFLYGTQTWFAKNNFSNPVSLTTNITRWTSLSWDTAGHFKTNLHDKFGTWVFDNHNGNYTNTTLGCEILFTKVRGDYGNYKTDLKNSLNYAKKFTTNQPDAKTKKAYISIEGYPQGGIQVLKTYYRGSNKNYNAAYYRHSPKNETIFLGIISCKTSAARDKVTPWSGNGQEVKTLGFWLKP